MNRVLAAVGQVARTPYRIEKIERNVWTAEELCYSLAQSAAILDPGIMDPQLVRWIGDEDGLNLPDLSKQLEPLLGKERALSDFVTTILDYVGLVPDESKQKTRRILQTVTWAGDDTADEDFGGGAGEYYRSGSAAGAGTDAEGGRENGASVESRRGGGVAAFERRLSRAKFFEENAQPFRAVEAYESVLRDLPAPEKRMRTEALCAEGRIFAGVFRYHQAAEYYKEAYECSGQSEVYLKYLAAVRMELPQEEYLAFLSEHPESYQASLELEKRMDHLNEEYDDSEMKSSVDMLKRYRDNHQDASYEIALHQMVGKLKKQYRDGRTPAV